MGLFYTSTGRCPPSFENGAEYAFADITSGVPVRAVLGWWPIASTCLYYDHFVAKERMLRDRAGCSFRPWLCQQLPCGIVVCKMIATWSEEGDKDLERHLNSLRHPIAYLPAGCAVISKEEWTLHLMQRMAE